MESADYSLPARLCCHIRFADSKHGISGGPKLASRLDGKPDIYNPLVHALPIYTWSETWSRVLDSWRDDSYNFIRKDVPRLIGILIVALVLLRILQIIKKHVEKMSRSTDLPSGMRAQ